LVAGTFRLVARCPETGARAGELVTGHGVVPTPVFLPVGSQASVKALSGDDVRQAGFAMLLANTYHLYLRPGIATIEKLGGLHRFMSWQGAILTDSGGYQVFSLAGLRRVGDGGITFRSHIDGSTHVLTAEQVIAYQEALGADVAMVLDECVAVDASPGAVRRAVDRTTRWAERCRRVHSRADQQLWAIVQGGLDMGLRQESARALVALDFPGYAIGGLSLGEPKEVTFAVAAATARLLPEDRPRYLMGVGSPEDLVEGVACGLDVFDSALPTRVARNGGLYTPAGRVNILNAACAGVDAPLEPGCDCYTCRTFSTAYLHHLFKARELLAYRLATIHNLRFMARLMEGLRAAIQEGTFARFRAAFQAEYHPSNEAVRREQKRRWLEARRNQGRPGS